MANCDGPVGARPVRTDLDSRACSLTGGEVTAMRRKVLLYLARSWTVAVLVVSCGTEPKRDTACS